MITHCKWLDNILLFIVCFLKVYCLTIINGCSNIEHGLRIIVHNTLNITSSSYFGIMNDHTIKCTFLMLIQMEKQLMSWFTFNVHHTTSQHVFHTYIKITVTTCKDSPHMCEFRDFDLSALLSSPSSHLSFSFLLPLSSSAPVSYFCSPF